MDILTQSPFAFVIVWLLLLIPHFAMDMWAFSKSTFAQPDLSLTEKDSKRVIDEISYLTALNREGALGLAFLAGWLSYEFNYGRIWLLVLGGWSLGSLVLALTRGSEMFAPLRAKFGLDR